VSYSNGQYHMYYSASTFRSNRSAIFLATSSPDRTRTHGLPEEGAQPTETLGAGDELPQRVADWLTLSTGPPYSTA
jgi:hypothetical protein